jgi:lipopolysaccharide/colanic/teichoic acid biosynthesis glycosyltransferase
MAFLAVIIADVSTILLAFIGAYSFRQSIDGGIQPLEFYAPFLIFSIAAYLFCSLLFSTYMPRRSFFSISYLSDFLRVFALWSFSVIAYSFFTKTQYARTVVFIFIVGSFASVYLLRFIFAWAARTEAGKDAEIRLASENILHVVRITEDPLSLLQSIRMHSSSTIIYSFAKRLLDVTLALLGLIVASPLFPYISWKIRTESEGPVFILQERVGQNGKRFTMYKFRTMHATAQLYANSPRAGDDPRVTPFGRILRHYSLDELPQLINILRGDMSVVGPRPEMPFIVETYAPWQEARLKVKPGLTGLWQILGRKDMPLEENLEYDLYYVFNQSLFLDFAILLKTLPHLVLPRGAY